MRQTRLIERLNSRPQDVPVGPPDLPGHSQTLVLAGVARALRDATRPKPVQIQPMAGPPPLPLTLEVPAVATDAPAADGEALPLVLTGRQPPAPAVRPEGRGTGQLTAPLLLGFAVAAIALLLAAPLPDTARVLGIDWLATKPRPKLARLQHVEPVAITHTLLHDTLLHDAGLEPAAVTTTDDQILLERCEAMISRGEIREAREELAKAAAEGRHIARFALAETFDPNVLAAWGLRDDVADAAVARTLYRQALDQGDRRASLRLNALAAGTQ